MFALADCNNFFASCERVFRPDLNGRPVIVLSNNDGCAVARSNEAKALGIKMGAPYFKIRDIIEKNDVAVFSSNFALYGDMSGRVQEVLRTFAPSVEQYSIDEAFMDFRGMRIDDYDALAKEISRHCRQLTAIPVSVGIAPTKTLAKIASKLCKQYPKLLKQIVIRVQKFMDTHPNAKSNEKFGNAYNLVYHNLFCDSYQDYLYKTQMDLFWNVPDCKQLLEKYFNVEL